jgi:hypothetical protein
MVELCIVQEWSHLDQHYGTRCLHRQDAGGIRQIDEESIFILKLLAAEIRLESLMNVDPACIPSVSVRHLVW